MGDWLESYLKAIVEHPDQVVLRESRGTKVVVFDIELNPQDVNLLKARRNRLLRALEQVAGLAGLKPRMRYVLNIA